MVTNELEIRKELISHIQPKILDMLENLGIFIETQGQLDLVLKTTETVVDDCIKQLNK